MFVFGGGGYDRQRTLVIRIAAITLASASAITIVRFRPSKFSTGKGKALYLPLVKIPLAQRSTTRRNKLELIKLCLVTPVTGSPGRVKMNCLPCVPRIAHNISPLAFRPGDCGTPAKKICVYIFLMLGNEKKPPNNKDMITIFSGLSRDFLATTVVIFLCPTREKAEKKKKSHNFVTPAQSRDNPANLFMFNVPFLDCT